MSYYHLCGYLSCDHLINYLQIPNRECRMILADNADGSSYRHIMKAYPIRAHNDKNKGPHI